MKVLAYRNDTLLLHQQLHYTQTYLRTYSYKKRLQIYLVGMYPFSNAFSDKIKDSANSILRFSIGEPPRPYSVLED